MSKHEQLLKHRNYTAIVISESGGLLIKFDDESHTYIPANEFLEIIKKMTELIENHKISFEEE